MMKFDALEIMNNAYDFASVMVMDKTKDEKFSQEKFLTLGSENVLGSKYGKTIVENLILGAICEYHSQLRKVLHEHGIDVEDFDFEID